MARDAKFGIVLDEAGRLGHDEPVFVLRAKDVTSGAVLAEYKRQCESYGAASEHIAAVDDVILTFARWQDANPASVKVPD